MNNSEGSFGGRHPHFVVIPGMDDAVTVGADKVALDEFGGDYGCAAISQQLGHAVHFVIAPVMEIKGGSRKCQGTPAAMPAEHFYRSFFHDDPSGQFVVFAAEAPATVLGRPGLSISTFPAKPWRSPGAKRPGQICAVDESHVVGVTKALRIGRAHAPFLGATIGALVYRHLVKDVGACMGLFVERGIKRTSDFFGGYHRHSLPHIFAKFYVKGFGHASL